MPAPRRALESAAAFVVSLMAAFAVNWRLLESDVISSDALVHQYWMWNWRDPALFTDPLTQALRESARYPEGYQALYWLPAQYVSPITFGEFVGIGLMALSGWLVWAIVREHTAWRPAAWIGAGLFLGLIDIHRFPGGFPRAFVHPVVLLTVLLSLRRHPLAAALVAAGGALFYPPAALLAVGVLAFSSLEWRGRLPGLDLRRAGFAVLAGGLAAAAVLVPQIWTGPSPEVLTADQARAYPEFGPDGPLHFFADSTLEFLRQNRSGFDLRATGSVLALAALAVALARPASLRSLRREVWALPAVALVAFAVAHLVLFRLYLPHRYTYPLVAFLAIAVAVGIGPAWQALWSGRGRRVKAFAALVAPLVLGLAAVHVFPLGPVRPLAGLESPPVPAVAAGAVALAALVALALGRGRRDPAALGAVVTGIALVLALPASAGRGLDRGSTCRTWPAHAFIRDLPKDAIIAGDPGDVECLPALTRRPVVVSRKLAPAYEREYFHLGRERMFAMLRAYYGPDPGAIARLGDRFGATHLWVRKNEIRRERRAPRGKDWPSDSLPWGRFVAQLLASGRPATLSLPEQCRRWDDGGSEVYDVACIARAQRRPS